MITAPLTPLPPNTPYSAIQAGECLRVEYPQAPYEVFRDLRLVTVRPKTKFGWFGRVRLRCGCLVWCAGETEDALAENAVLVVAKGWGCETPRAHGGAE